MCHETCLTCLSLSNAVNCTGHVTPAGTGPYRFEKKVTNKRTIGLESVADATIDVEGGENVTEVHFVAFPNYWGGVPAIDRIVAVVYVDHSEILAALLDGSLDLSYGSATLEASDFKIASEQQNNALLQTEVSKPLNTRLVAINSGR
jgi:ABC-type transport system substrate-binding protein